MITTLTITLVSYFLLVLVVGFWKLRSQTKAGYVSAPDSTGFCVLTLSLIGTIVGGGMFLGIAQIGYNGGMTALALGVAYLVGSLIIGLLAPTLRQICRKRGISTLFGLFESLYPSKSAFSVARIFTWTTFVVFLLMLAVQFLSIATFLKYYVDINFALSLLFGAGVIAVISTIFQSAFGGFTRDLWTDVIQVSFITLGVVLVIVAESSNPDLRMKLATLPPGFFTVGSSGIVFFVGSLFFVAPTFLIRFDLWQRIITAKTDSVAKSAFMASGLIAFIFFSFFGLLGMYGRALGVSEEDGQFVALEVIKQKVSGIPYSLVIAAFFAAVMSTADTFLGVTALALAKGTIFRAPGSLEVSNDDPTFVHRLRRMTLFIGVGSLFLAYVMRDIVDAFALAFGLLMVFLPAMIGGLLSDRPDERRARGSVVSGLVALLVFSLFSPTTAYLAGIVCATFTYLFFWRERNRTDREGGG
jgi:solute:Na+ symporter, SSS family